MNQQNKNITAVIVVLGLIVLFLWWLSTPPESRQIELPNREPERIQRQFKNGRVIDMEVDKTITRDNWVCTGDCSGHEAGYEWAEEKGISDPSDCGGNSESFIEGCEAYANEYGGF